MPTRRDFITTMGGMAIGATALSRVRSLSAAEFGAKLPAIGIQLYTLRSLMEKDLDGTLATVAKIGYREVEFAGYFGRTPAQVRSLLRANKLTSPSTHIAYPATDDAWAHSLDSAAEIGHKWVVIAYLDAAMRSKPGDWARIADRYNELGAKAKAHGLRFAYHNHDFEFERTGDTTALELLLSRTDPALVDFEMDIYWVVKGGGDPLALIKHHAHRFPLMHAKDATAAPEHTMTEVGSGTIDFKTIFRNARLSGMQHVYVEHDSPTDPIESARTSYRNLAALRY